nr:hypothetical protein [Tanacetum cinerariifolium]
EVAGRGGRQKKVTGHGAHRKKVAGRGGRRKKVTSKGGLHEEGVWSVEPDLFRSGGRQWKKVEDESLEKVCWEDESPMETGWCQASSPSLGLLYGVEVMPRASARPLRHHGAPFRTMWSVALSIELPPLHAIVDSEVMKGLSECKASENNIRRIRVKGIVKKVKDYLKIYSSAGMDISSFDTMPTTTDPINTTTTTNVSQSVVDESLPQLLDSKGGSHVINVPAFDKEDFTSWKVWFLLFFDGLEPYLLKTLKDGPFIPIEQIILSKMIAWPLCMASTVIMKDSDSDFEEDQRIVDLNAEYQERALLANQKRFYKRSGRVGLARKPLDKSKETCRTLSSCSFFVVEALVYTKRSFTLNGAIHDE